MSANILGQAPGVAGTLVQVTQGRTSSECLLALGEGTVSAIRHNE